jgi:hypothetical protein
MEANTVLGDWGLRTYHTTRSIRPYSIVPQCKGIYGICVPLASERYASAGTLPKTESGIGPYRAGLSPSQL